MKFQKQLATVLVSSFFLTGCFGPWAKSDIEGVVQIPQDLSATEKEVIEEVIEKEENYDFSEWEALNKAVPDKTTSFVLKMSEDLKTQILGIVEESYGSLPEDLQSELEYEIGDIETIQEMLSQLMDPIHHMAFQMHVSDSFSDEVAALIEKAETALSSEGNGSRVLTEEDGARILKNICLSADLHYDDKNLMDMILEQSEQVKQLPILKENLSLSFQPGGRLFVQFGGACEGQKSFMDTMLASDLTAGSFENGFMQTLYPLFEANMEKIKTMAQEESNVSLQSLFDILTKVNYISVLRDQKVSGIAIKIIDKGFKTHHYSEYGEETLAHLRSTNLRGRAMAKPLYLSKDNVFVSAHDVKATQVMHYESTSQIDPSFFVGQYMKIYDGFGGIMTIGILGTISTATFSGYFEKAQDTEAQTFVRNAQQIIIASQVVNDVADYRLGETSLEGVRDTFERELETQGYSVPSGDNGVDYYYALNTNDGVSESAFDFVVMACNSKTGSFFKAGTVDLFLEQSSLELSCAWGEVLSLDGWTFIPLHGDLPDVEVVPTEIEAVSIPSQAEAPKSRY